MVKPSIFRVCLIFLLSIQLAALPVLASFTDIQSNGNPTVRDFKVLLDMQSPTFSDAVRSQQVDVNGNPLNLGNLSGVYDPFAVPTQTALPYAKALETESVK